MFHCFFGSTFLPKDIFAEVNWRVAAGFATGSPSSKYMYVVHATACVSRELYGKITDRKKNCVNNYLI